VIYRSAYDGAFLDGLAAKLARHAKRASRRGAIFDNTMLGAATANALALLDRLAPMRRRSPGQPVG
jgi:uncharacterized protein YecE (DUF72 family)